MGSSTGLPTRLGGFAFLLSGQVVALADCADRYYWCPEMQFTWRGALTRLVPLGYTFSNNIKILYRFTIHHAPELAGD